MALNKKDVVTREDLSPEYQARLDKLESEGVILLNMSTLTEDGVDDVRNEVCIIISTTHPHSTLTHQHKHMISIAKLFTLPSLLLL